jgi:hypothetical protein
MAARPGQKQKQKQQAIMQATWLRVAPSPAASTKR